MKSGCLFAAPALAGLALFVALPFGLACLLSFSNLRLGSPLPAEFVGLQQYARIFSDSVFLQALGNTLLFAALIVPLQTGLALGLALMLNGPRSGTLRALFFTPVVLPMTLVSVIWIPLYAESGCFNRLLQLLGGQPIDFLRDPAWALPSLVLVSVWQGLGLQMVVLLAGLQSISPELYEAARLDGAGRLQRHWHVTIPQLRAPLLFTVVTTTVLALRIFDQVQILTEGGPGGATATLVFHIVTTGLERLQIGQACALTVCFFVLVLTVSLIPGTQRQERA